MAQLSENTINSCANSFFCSIFAADYYSNIMSNPIYLKNNLLFNGKLKECCSH